MGEGLGTGGWGEVGPCQGEFADYAAILGTWEVGQSQETFFLLPSCCGAEVAARPSSVWCNVGFCPIVNGQEGARA